LHLIFTHSAFQTKDNLLGCLGLLMKDGFSLSSIARLLAIVSTLPLCGKRVFTLLVLCYFVRGVLSAVFVSAERPTCLRNVNHFCREKQPGDTTGM